MSSIPLFEGVFFDLDGTLADTAPDLVAACDYQQHALQRLDANALAYLQGGAADELTCQANLNVWQDWALLPRLLRDLLGRVLAAGLVPAADPAERTCNHKGRDLGVAGLDRALGHAFGHQAAELLVDGGLEAAQLLAAFGGHLLVAHADQAHAEVHGDDARIHLHAGHELVDGLAACGAGCVDAFEHHRQPLAHALQQDLVLVLHVVVQRGLGHVQARSDVVERGGVKAALVEQLGRRLQHGVALGLTLSFAVRDRSPGRSGVGRVFGPGGRGCG